MIIPIVTPNIDFKNLLYSIKSGLNRNLNIHVDSNKEIVPESALAYLAELLELAETNNSQLEMIIGYNLTDHLYYSFLTALELEDIILLRCYTSLSVVYSEEQFQHKKAVIISGNLTAWKNAILYFGTQTCNYTFKIIAKHLYLYFDNLKLAKLLWSNYTPIYTQTGQLLLERKN